MSSGAIPRATYRLQFNADFTFSQAARIVPYLNMLGVSHIYASPFLKARAGSPHGYDIVDHTALNPEIGDAHSLSAYVETLHRHDMGQLLDMVPNHMGVGGDDNRWWLDVLENGEASPHAGFFDIDWHPVNTVLHNKILLPFLGDHYGTVLEQGELELSLDEQTGTFAVHYYEHLFPLDPRTYPRILGFHLARLEQRLAPDHAPLGELRALIDECRSLPRRTELSARRRRQRLQGGAACKRRLAELCTRQAVREFLQENVRHFNGRRGDAASYEPLHQLLEAQAYRLAYWRVASDEINYRRFFDINDLAGLRMENREVFDATHRLVLQLARDGQIDGLRIDHPDGLSDPRGYCRDLQRALAGAAPESNAAQAGFYVLVEKILMHYERLPQWPVSGTTGYEVAHLINGLYVNGAAERALTRIYRRFTERTQDFEELLYRRKKLIVRSVLASELSVLANLAGNIAQSDRHTRDFTYHGLRDALAEVAACFPVYRTYITRDAIGEEDRRYIHWAVAQARKRSPLADMQIFDFIQDLLSLTDLSRHGSRVRRHMVQFAQRFQQYTAPVMAKGMEDTTFYDFNRLVSLNDVGFHPGGFGVSIAAFHQENHQRRSLWPHNMVAGSTHDSKRGEDVRARINVLSEIPQQWRKHLARWSRINQHKKPLVDEAPAPSANDEYLLYQTLVGTWPIGTLDENAYGSYCERIEAYMIKAAKEAKSHTSWTRPNEEYEQALRDFVRALLDDPERNPFLADFIPFQGNILRHGLLNSLSQTLLRLTVPGVPDIYQGNELWCFNLVDPDNRRPVDYAHRQATLEHMVQRCQGDTDPADYARELLEQMEDGRVKLYVLWQTLALRRRYPALFAEGEYQPLQAEGPRADHICAFRRRVHEHEAIVVATRWFAMLGNTPGALPLGETLWQDTRVCGLDGAPAGAYRNIFTGERIPVHADGTDTALEAPALFRNFPLAVLIREDMTPAPRA